MKPGKPMSYLAVTNSVRGVAFCDFLVRPSTFLSMVVKSSSPHPAAHQPLMMVRFTVDVNTIRTKALLLLYTGVFNEGMPCERVYSYSGRVKGNRFSRPGKPLFSILLTENRNLL
ncbi:hypothetical protein VNO77_19084 [Canavalia gladiata]|uniref:Uncharacterized protein n=1 Tax=Canavalia gladiata TaxID=3824 RepID=A0AAN9LQQ6_CANGL